jgi:hypothetical protein
MKVKKKASRNEDFGLRKLKVSLQGVEVGCCPWKVHNSLPNLIIAARI